MPRPILALDADGVLLDLHLGYASAWERAFGAAPRERDPQAYWPIDRWDVPRLDESQREHFRRFFGVELWSAMAPIEGALPACERLSAAGYELVCVTALDPQYEAARLHNLRSLGFPIERVIATGNGEGERSPKADAITELRPVAFVDDYLPYLRGLPREVHCALVLRAPNGSPNQGPELDSVASIHQDLAAFTDAWLAGAARSARMSIRPQAAPAEPAPSARRR